MRTKLVKLYKGILYFPDFQTAENIRTAPRLLVEFPESRVVSYTRGWAIQIRKSDDYLGVNLRPSMENAMETFFSA